LLRRHVTIDVHERQPGAGFGSFSLRALFGQGRCWALGERAGLQDFLWGFGIRRALESAALAARCWVVGGEYPALAARAFGFPDRTALVNRYLWDATAARGLPIYVRLLSRGGDVRSALGRATAERWLHRALYPLVWRHARQRFPFLAAAG
jgi:flavin-dependent dehydrogenase